MRTRNCFLSAVILGLVAPLLALAGAAPGPIGQAAVAAPAGATPVWQRPDGRWNHSPNRDGFDHFACRSKVYTNANGQRRVKVSTKSWRSRKSISQQRTYLAVGRDTTPASGGLVTTRLIRDTYNNNWSGRWRTSRGLVAPYNDRTFVMIKRGEKAPLRIDLYVKGLPVCGASGKGSPQGNWSFVRAESDGVTHFACRTRIPDTQRWRVRTATRVPASHYQNLDDFHVFAAITRRWPDNHEVRHTRSVTGTGRWVRTTGMIASRPYNDNLYIQPAYWGPPSYRRSSRIIQVRQLAICS